MKFSVKNIPKKFSKNQLIVLSIISVISVGLAGTAYATISHTNNERDKVAVEQKQNPIKNEVKTSSEAAAPLSESSTTSTAEATPSIPSQSAESAPAPAAQPSQPSTVKSNTPSPKVKSNDAPSNPFKLINIVASGQDVCTSGVRRLFLGYAYIHTSPYPGVVNWQIEVRRNNTVSIIRSGSVDMSLHDGAYEIKNTYDMYTQASSSDVAIRLHVTSPSDMSSAWFTSEPMSAGSPCSQY